MTTPSVAKVEPTVIERTDAVHVYGDVPELELCPEGMAYIPDGTFRMGVDANKAINAPARDVFLSAYCMDKTEVTRADFSQFMLESGRAQDRFRYQAYVEDRAFDLIYLLSAPTLQELPTIQNRDDFLDSLQAVLAGKYNRSSVKHLIKSYKSRLSEHAKSSNSLPPPDQLKLNSENYVLILDSLYNERIFSENNISSKSQWPASNMTWKSARDYCLAQGKRLPTEAEWKRAAVGPDGQDQYATLTGGLGDLLANTRVTGLRHPVNVASYPPNRFGIHDLTGNVSEFVADYLADYVDHPEFNNNPTGPKNGKDHVVRGGDFSDSADHVLTRSRYIDYYGEDNTNMRHNNITLGFRCVATPLQSPLEE